MNKPVNCICLECGAKTTRYNLENISCTKCGGKLMRRNSYRDNSCARAKAELRELELSLTE